MGSVESTQTASANGTEKKSLYRRYHDSKTGRDKSISDEDMLKYTGKTKAQVNEWAKTAPGVAGNQAAGKLDMGPTSGLGGVATADGYGGWGFDSNAPPKYPPNPPKGEPVDK